MLVSVVLAPLLVLASTVIAAPVSHDEDRTYTIVVRQNAAAVSTLSASAKSDVAVFANLARYVSDMWRSSRPR